MTIKKILMTVGLGLGLFGAGATALASSHREAPAISQDPAADNNDVYAWVNAGTHDMLNVVMTYNPLEEPSGGPNFNEFSTDVLYELHITRGPNSLADVYTYQFQFSKDPIPYVDVANLALGPGGGKEFFAQLSTQKMYMTVTRIDNTTGTSVTIAEKVPVAPVDYGPRTQAVLKTFNLASSDTYDTAFTNTFIAKTAERGRVWAGPRDDAFYVDLGGVFDLANFRTKGNGGAANAQDGVAGFNTHAIVIEIPTSTLTQSGRPPTPGASDAQTLGIWASASRREMSMRLRNGSTISYGPWVQVSRQGLPLINEAVIGLQDKDRWNYDRPSRELFYFPYFLNPIIVRDAEAVGTYGPGGQLNGVAPGPYKSARTDIIDVINLKASGHNISMRASGDVLRVDMGMDSAFPNGRTLVNAANVNREGADVTDVILSLFLAGLSKPVTDGVDYNDRALPQAFPWLAQPWRGFDQGHGKNTP